MELNKKIVGIVLLLLLSFTAMAEEYSFEDFGNIEIKDASFFDIVQQSITISNPNPQPGKEITITLRYKPVSSVTSNSAGIACLNSWNTKDFLARVTVTKKKAGVLQPGDIKEINFGTEVKCGVLNTKVITFTPSDSGTYQIQYYLHHKSSSQRIQLETESGRFGDNEVRIFQVGMTDTGFQPKCTEVGRRDITVNGRDVGELVTKTCQVSRTTSNTITEVYCIKGYIKNGESCKIDSNFVGTPPRLNKWVIDSKSGQCISSKTGFDTKEICEKTIYKGKCGNNICERLETASSCEIDCFVPPDLPDLDDECTEIGVLKNIDCGNGETIAVSECVSENGKLIIKNNLAITCDICNSNEQCDSGYLCESGQCVIDYEPPIGGGTSDDGDTSDNDGDTSDNEFDLVDYIKKNPMQITIIAVLLATLIIIIRRRNA